MSDKTVVMDGSTAHRTRGRQTRQGVAIDRALADADGFLSAQELHTQLSARGERVGLATVYRHLQRLAEQGTVDSVQSADGQLVYRACAVGHHHHHLVCRACGAAKELESGEVERWATKQASVHGFSDVEHTIEIFGTCATCRSTNDQREQR